MTYPHAQSDMTLRRHYGNIRHTAGGMKRVKKKCFPNSREGKKEEFGIAKVLRAHLFPVSLFLRISAVTKV